MGIVSDRCELNRQIRADNKLLRDHMVLIQYQLIVNASQQEVVSFQKELLTDILAEYKTVKAEFKAKTVEKPQLIVEHNSGRSSPERSQKYAFQMGIPVYNEVISLPVTASISP